MRKLYAAASALALSVAAPALAQERPPGEAAVSEIVVTGSRIKKDGFDSPVPLTVVDSTLVQKLGQANAQDVHEILLPIEARCGCAQPKTPFGAANDVKLTSTTSQQGY